MLQSVEYCKCGNELRYIFIFLKQSKHDTIAERKPICTRCLNSIEIDLEDICKKGPHLDE